MDAQVHSVWVVQGFYGDYSDYTEHQLVAFLCKKQAEDCLAKVQKEYKEKRVWYSALEDSDPKSYWLLYDSKEAVLESCPQVNYTTYYEYDFRITEIPLRAEE